MRGPQTLNQNSPNPVRDGGKGYCPIPPELIVKVLSAVEVVNDVVAPTVNDIYRKYVKGKVSIEDEHDARVTLEAMIADIVEKVTKVETMIHENIGEYPALVIDIRDDFKIEKVWYDRNDEETITVYELQGAK